MSGAARLRVALILAGAGVVAAGLALAAGEAPGRAAGGAAGALLAGLGGAAGLVAVLRARERDPKTFMRAVFGGMLLRLSGYGAALVAVHLATSWSLGWFAGGLLGSHLLGQAIEIEYLLRGGPGGPPAGGQGETQR